MKNTTIWLAVLCLSVILTGCGQEPARQAPPAPTVPLKVKTQAQLDLTTNFYLVIDGSGSMQGHKMEGAKEAVRQALNKVPDDVNIGLYVFDAYGPSERVPLGPGTKPLVLEKVDAISADNGTPLGSAIASGTAALKAQREKQHGYGTYRLIVVTDGECDKDDPTPLPKAVKEAKDNKIPIYTVGVEMSGDHALRIDSVEYRGADSPADVAKALTDFSTEGSSYDPKDFEQQ